MADSDSEVTASSFGRLQLLSLLVIALIASSIFALFSILKGKTKSLQAEKEKLAREKDKVLGSLDIFSED